MSCIRNIKVPPYFTISLILYLVLSSPVLFPILGLEPDPILIYQLQVQVRLRAGTVRPVLQM